MGSEAVHQQGPIISSVIDRSQGGKKEERSNEQVAGGTSECVILPPGHLIVPAYALAHSTE